MKADDLTPEKIAELKQKHGEDLTRYTLPDGSVLVFHKPDSFVWERFIRDTAEEKDKLSTIEQLALGCLAAPNEAEAKASFKKYQSATLSILDVITKLGGGGGDTKKL